MFSHPHWWDARSGHQKPCVVKNGASASGWRLRGLGSLPTGVLESPHEWWMNACLKSVLLFKEGCKNQSIWVPPYHPYPINFQGHTLFLSIHWKFTCLFTLFFSYFQLLQHLYSFSGLAPALLRSSSEKTPHLIRDFVTSHYITDSHLLHNLCTAASLADKNRFSTIVVSGAGSGVCELTNQSRLGFRRRGLKETGAKIENLSTVLQHRTERENWCVFWALKHLNLF